MTLSNLRRPPNHTFAGPRAVAWPPVQVSLCTQMGVSPEGDDAWEDYQWPLLRLAESLNLYAAAVDGPVDVELYLELNPEVARMLIRAALGSLVDPADLGEGYGPTLRDRALVAAARRMLAPLLEDPDPVVDEAQVIEEPF